MERINATSLGRKSRQMGHPAFVAGGAKTTHWTRFCSLGFRALAVGSSFLALRLMSLLPSAENLREELRNLSQDALPGSPVATKNDREEYKQGET